MTLSSTVLAKGNGVGSASSAHGDGWMIQGGQSISIQDSQVTNFLMSFMSLIQQPSIFHVWRSPPASCLLQLLGSLPGVHPLSWDVAPEVMTGPAFSKLSSAPVIKKLHHTALGNSQEFSWTWWALSFFLLSGQKAPGWGMAEDPCHCLGSQERVPRQAPGT